MNAGEMIQAAIDRLMELRSRTPGIWEAGDDGYVHANGAWVIGNATDTTDAELIVTLHRTIDAQLAILRDTEYRYAEMWEKEPDRPIIATSGRNALDLARAILGGAK